MNRQEVSQLIKDKELVLGFEQSLKTVKSKKAEVVIVASNSPKSFSEALGKVEVFDGTSKDLGIICGKPFNIAVLTVVK